MRLKLVGAAAFVAGLGALSMLSGCAQTVKNKGKSSASTASSAPTPPPREVVTPTAAPTVPPPGSTDFPTPRAPLSTKGLKPGEAIGPEITFFGITRADGKAVEPANNEGGIPTYKNYV